MNQFHLSIVVAAGISLLTARSYAEPPAGVVQASAAEAPAANQGPAVLLRSGQVMYGKARQDGEKIIIEGPTSTVRLHRRDVACWGDSVASLYQYRIDHRPAQSSQSRMEDAKWCMDNGLYSEAATELNVIRESIGNHPRIAELERRLEILRDQAKQQAADKSRVVPAGATTVPEPMPDTAAVNLPRQLFSTPAMQRFTASVQPMLLNRCATAGCHGARPSAKPHLEGWRFGTTAPITNRNLQEVGQYINESVPLESRLLRMATSPHGGSMVLSAGTDQPLRDRLQEWVILASGQTTQSAPSIASPSANGMIPMQQVPVMMAPPTIAPGSTVPASSQAPAGAPQGTNAPKRLPTISDPFDPEVFNRTYAEKSE